ncbi:hypothetical protein KRR38_27250 [Novosphingobium sp. G106]|uniref:hypothetical protein n=1 Tax=Novosphingobium sp. G106 TaxID=2849500 RepID=UPI001C2D1A18|nr:hypothetical protein [Novosphingobium sp. G106]MBV1691280.1 hypothetical protein [Novosphingobium sp. G106]
MGNGEIARHEAAILDVARGHRSQRDAQFDWIAAPRLPAPMATSSSIVTPALAIVEIRFQIAIASLR